MVAPAREIVEPELAGLSQQIVEIVLDAWTDWRESPHAAVWRCKRSRAGFVWEQMIERAHSEFAFEVGVRILNGRETFSFLVNDRVLFRFKKADESGMTSNYPTQLALAFHEHGRDLFGFSDVVRVEVAYTLNALETEIADIIVVGRDGKNVVWTYSLMDAADGIVPLPMPETTEDPEERSARRLVKARSPEAEERKRRD